MAIESIAKTLGSGSGIDIGALVTSLVEAQFAAKNQEIARREEKLEAQISGVSALKSALTNFDKALGALVAGGTLASQPISSDVNSVAVSLLPDATIKNLQATIGVTQLASAQASTTNKAYDAALVFKEGTLTFGFTKAGTDATTQPKDVTLTVGAGQTLQQIADQINANAQLGGRVTATLVKDGAGSRLVMKSAMGAENSFTVAATDKPNRGATVVPPTPAYTNTGETLDGFDVGGSVTATGTGAYTGAAARDAIITMDGAQYRRTSNTVTDLFPGLKLDLLKVTTGNVNLSVEKPTTALSEGLTNFVDAYNEMLSIVMEQDDPQSGALRLDTAVDTLRRDLRGLTTRQLITTATAGAPRSLADLGVRTQRDGTLSVDSTRLAKVIADFPAEVESIFTRARAGSTQGLSAALGEIAKRMTGTKTGLSLSAETYGKQLRTLETAKLRASEDTERLRERLTRQFSTMDARTAAYKSTQTFLDNQIKAWNASGD